jgi:hypothetical protein
MVLEGTTTLFKFKITALDWQGQTHYFELPLFWVSKPLAEGPDDTGWTNAMTDYRRGELNGQTLRDAGLNGQKIAYVPTVVTRSASLARRDNSITTAGLTFNIVDKADPSTGLTFPVDWPIRPPFPQRSLRIRLPLRGGMPGLPCSSRTVMNDLAPACYTCSRTIRVPAY